MVGKPQRGRMGSIRKELVGIQGGVTTGGPCLSTSKALLETLGGGRCPGLESRCPELSGVLGCLGAIVLPPHYPRFPPPLTVQNADWVLFCLLSSCQLP